MELETVKEAIRYIDSDNRDTYITVGMALKDKYGDLVFDIWNDWAQLSDAYNQNDALIDWRSFRIGKGRGFGSFVWLARSGGWMGFDKAISPDEMERLKRESEAERAREEQKRAIHARDATELAHELLEMCVIRTHPYLARKGFALANTLVLPMWKVRNRIDSDGRFKYLTSRSLPMRIDESVIERALAIPIRDSDRSLMSLQLIGEFGDKKFLYGGSVRGGYAMLGRGNELWYVEGYATALSVQKALNHAGIFPSICITFNASNLLNVASHGFVVADHDKLDRSGHRKGETFAKRSGLPYWLPEDIGDANDVHVDKGLLYLSDQLRSFRDANINQRN